MNYIYEYIDFFTLFLWSIINAPLKWSNHDLNQSKITYNGILFVSLYQAVQNDISTKSLPLSLMYFENGCHDGTAIERQNGYLMAADRKPN